MYTLTLSREERAAIDWVGNRYPHGEELFDILCGSNWDTPSEWGWFSDDDITFTLSESEAWGIHSIAEEGEYRWDCFAPNLARKLTYFVEGIV